jgi:hypothetical protein
MEILLSGEVPGSLGREGGGLGTSDKALGQLEGHVRPRRVISVTE